MPVLQQLGGRFRLSGDLMKLKHEVHMFGSAWNKRFFQVEQRVVGDREELVLAYYQTVEQSATPVDAKDFVLLRNVVRVQEVWQQGKLVVSKMSSLTDRKSKQINKHKELVFEVDTSKRHFFLQANDHEDLCRWVSALQFICDQDQTLPWPHAFGRLPPVPRGSRTAKHSNFYTDVDNVEAPEAPHHSAMPLPTDLDYGIAVQPKPVAHAKATPNDLQHRLEAAIRARAGGAAHEDDDFYNYADSPSPKRGAGAGAGAHHNSPTKSLDRAGVAYDTGGRTVGAHLSMASMPTPGTRGDSPTGFDSRKVDDDDDAYDAEDRTGAAAPAPATATFNEEHALEGKQDQDEDDLQEQIKARMARRAKKQKAAKARKAKERQKGKHSDSKRRSRDRPEGKSRNDEDAAPAEPAAEPEPDPEEEAKAAMARKAGVAADEDFAEANWDEDDNGKTAEDERKEALRDPGVKVDADFLDANWDDDMPDTPQQEKPQRRRADPGVKADENFAEEDWDD